MYQYSSLCNRLAARVMLSPSKTCISSVGIICLTLLAEFIHQKMRNVGRLPTKKAVQKVGPQEDGTWVLGPDIYINPEGEIIDPSQSQYMWISHLLMAQELPPNAKHARSNNRLPLSPCMLSYSI